jgi:hypothetical protein
MYLPAFHVLYEEWKYTVKTPCANVLFRPCPQTLVGLQIQPDALHSTNGKLFHGILGPWSPGQGVECQDGES